MKTKIAIMGLLIVGLISCGEKQMKKADLSNDKAKASYGIGQNIGENFKQGQLTTEDIDITALAQGLEDALNDTSVIAKEELREVLTKFQTDMQQKSTERMKVESEKNKKIGEAFLNENKTKEGVKVTDSGLQYKVVKEGTGKQPKPTDKVTVNYEGKLIDGTIFDSSYKSGKPATFGVTGVIKGWIEGLQLMKEGATYEFYIPAELAYGDRGAGQLIKPGTTLIFKVELIKIN